MEITFFVKNEKYEEYNNFVKDLKSVKTVDIPYLTQDEKWEITISIDEQDDLLLNQLFQKWYFQENPPKIKTQTLFKEMINLFA